MVRYSFYNAKIWLYSWTDEITGEKYRVVRANMFKRKKDAIAWLNNFRNRPIKITAGMYMALVYSRGKWADDEIELTVSY